MPEELHTIERRYERRAYECPAGHAGTSWRLAEDGFYCRVCDRQDAGSGSFDALRHGESGERVPPGRLRIAPIVRQTEFDRRADGESFTHRETVRVPPCYRSAMQNLVEDGTFANNSDLIRAGIRRVLEERGVV
jgi:hypothetical protein